MTSTKENARRGAAGAESVDMPKTAHSDDTARRGLCERVDAVIEAEIERRRTGTSADLFAAFGHWERACVFDCVRQWTRFAAERGEL